MGKVERMGTGFEKMKRLMLESKLKEPIFTSTTFFYTIFYCNFEYSLKPDAKKVYRKVLSVIKENPSITTYEMAESFRMKSYRYRKNR